MLIKTCALTFVKKRTDRAKSACGEVDDAKVGKRRLSEDDAWDHENARGDKCACRVRKDVPEDESRILRA